MAGNDAIVSAGSPLNGLGSPVGVVTPSAIGQIYYDTTTGNEGMWVSNGMTSSSRVPSTTIQ